MAELVGDHRALLAGADGGAAVMVAGSDGLAHRRPVETGIRTATAVQITRGVSASDNVITEGSYGLDDGTKVALGGASKPAAEEKD